MLGGVALACAASGAEAADARHRLSIAPKPYADALIDLAIQANVSLVGASACGAGGRAGLAGRFTLEEALVRLLAGAPCRFRIVDPHTVQITPLPAAPKAERPDPPAPLLVGEVVVTATKRPASLERLPAGVSVISREQLALTGSADVGRTVGQLAGVLTTNLGPGRDKLMIRGLSDGAFTGRTRSTVSTYLDETPINYNAPDPDLRLADVERVEVVRGPQGALYGSGALSGIYRIVTRKPDLHAREIGLGAAAAWTEGGDPSHELEGYVSLPLAAGAAAVRLVAYEERQGGYLDDVNLRVADVDRTVRDGGRLALRAQVGDGWRLDALAAVQSLRSNDTQYITAEPGRPQRANRLREVHNNDFGHLGATLQGELGWASLSSSLAYVRHDFSSQYDASEIDIFSPAGPAPELAVYEEKARVSMLVEDLVLRSSGAGRFGWLVGAYASRTVEESPSALRVRMGGAPIAAIYREARKDKIEEVAVYGEGSWTVAPGWTASIGGRLFESHVRTTADVSGLAPTVPRFFQSGRRFTGFLPKISLQREFAGGDLVYVLFSEGFRPGGFNSGGILPIRQSRTTFKPDRLRNYEVGAKLRLLDRRLALRAAAYYDEWENIQSDQYRPSGLSYTANVSDARVLGLEAEAGYDWDFGLSVHVNGLLADSELVHANPDFASELIDDLPGVPDVSGGVLAVYQRPLSGRLELRLTAEASYVGRSEISFDAARAASMGGYLRTRLSAELGTDRWRAQAYVSNPIDAAGDTFAYGNPFSFAAAPQVTPQRPRTFGVRLAAAF